MFQQITIIGNLGRKPELHYTPKGKAVTNFSVAVNNYQDKTAWFEVTVWGNQAEACSEYLQKGSKVMVEGRLEFDEDTGAPPTYTSKKDGRVHARFKITARQVLFLSNTRPPAEQSEQETPPWRS